MGMSGLQEWADNLTRGRKVRIWTTPVLGAFRDWDCPEDAVYDQRFTPDQPHKRI